MSSYSTLPLSSPLVVLATCAAATKPIVPPSMTTATVTVNFFEEITREQFASSFHNHSIILIPEDNFCIFPAGQQAAYTHGVATKLGIIAKAYDSNGQLKHIGIMNGAELHLSKFLCGMKDFDRTISKIYLNIFGGYSTPATNYYYTTFYKQLNEFKTNLSIPTITINTVLANPWQIRFGNFKDSYDTLIDVIQKENIYFALSIGVTATGEVKIADNSSSPPSPGQIFASYIQVIQHHCNLRQQRNTASEHSSPSPVATSIANTAIK